MQERINIIKRKGFVFNGAFVDIDTSKDLHIDKWKDKDNPKLIETID